MIGTEVSKRIANGPNHLLSSLKNQKARTIKKDRNT